MATVNTIEKIFSNMTHEQRQSNLATLAYIRQLASNTNTNISRWNILKTFGSGDSVNLLLDKKQINKIFFEKLEKWVDKNQDEPFREVDQIPELAKVIEDNVIAELTNRINDLKSSIENKFYDVKNLSSRIASTMDMIVGLRKQLMLLSSQNPTEALKKEINNVLKEKKWINPVVHEGFLYLNTGSNIVLTHKNKAANIDITIDVGQFAVKIDLKSFNPLVIPYKNNLSADRFYHPHIDDGHICWGNAQETAMRAIADLNIGKMLELLHAVLSLYNDANPYISLHYFNPKTRYRVTSDYLRHPEKMKNNECNALDSTSTVTSVVPNSTTL